MKLFLAILIILVGDIIAFLLSIYYFHKIHGDLNGEDVFDSFGISACSWISVLVMIAVLIDYRILPHFGISGKIAKQLNKLFSKKNNHKEK